VQLGASVAVMAASASRRPAPATGSRPGAATSAAVAISVLWICAGVRQPFFCKSKAATAAVSGAAADVPKNGLKPGTNVLTPSKPPRSTVPWCP
jgi:hypothetical protein